MRKQQVLDLCLRWQPNCRILKTLCLRWVPTGKTFASSTTKVESEPTNGSNEDIPNQCKSEQALNNSEFKTTGKDSQVQSRYQKLFLSKQDSYITTRVGITIHLFHSKAEDNRVLKNEKEIMDKRSKKEDLTQLRQKIGFTSVNKSPTAISLRYCFQNIPSDTISIQMKMEILLESASNKLLVVFLPPSATTTTTIQHHNHPQPPPPPPLPAPPPPLATITTIYTTITRRHHHHRPQLPPSDVTTTTSRHHHHHHPPPPPSTTTTTTTAAITTTHHHHLHHHHRHHHHHHTPLPTITHHHPLPPPPPPSAITTSGRVMASDDE
ncbi:hypothetical protein Tco_0541447 [Tanacetum coccineum]